MKIRSSKSVCKYFHLLTWAISTCFSATHTRVGFLYITYIHNITVNKIQHLKVFVAFQVAGCHLIHSRHGSSL